MAEQRHGRRGQWELRGRCQRRLAGIGIRAADEVGSAMPLNTLEAD